MKNDPINRRGRSDKKQFSKHPECVRFAHKIHVVRKKNCLLSPYNKHIKRVILINQM